MIDELERGTTTERALAWFDSLPSMPAPSMIGRWRGSGLPTSHPMDGLLEELGWYGKHFESDESVHPLLFRFGDTVSPIQPALVPMSLVVRHARLLHARAIPSLFALVGRLARTRHPAARLRTIEHRGVSTAAMIYDRLPICDVFRKVDDDTALGLMDLRGMEQPFFFVLRRER
ncbi:MAG: DUF4334 domain-containing protein [Polyangia bacterium]